MTSLLAPGFVNQTVTQDDMNIASLTWGFTLGFGFLTTWTAVKQTRHVAKLHGAGRLNSPYIWMIWLEIAVCLVFSVICWLHLRGFIPPSFAFYFCILTLWALQVQFLLQVIINRVSVLLVNRHKGNQLKIIVAASITLINVSVYCIWIPARLQVSEKYIHLNEIWDRCEKIIYLFVDAALNWYFIRIIQKNLVRQGLKKYESLVKFNIYIIGFSLSMDVLIISMMSLKNSFVYMQFHPLAYIVKLKIEMSMADLIATVSRSANANSNFELNRGYGFRPEGIDNRNKAGARTTYNGGMDSMSSSNVDDLGRKVDRNSDYAEDKNDTELKEIMRSGGIGLPQIKDIHSAGLDDLDDHDDDDYVPREGPLVVHQQRDISVEVENASPSGAPSLGDDSDERPLRSTNTIVPAIKNNFGHHTKVWGGGSRNTES